MFTKASLAAPKCRGFMVEIIKERFLEVGDKLLIYIQHAEGNLFPMGDSCAVSLRSVRQRPSERTPALLLRGHLLLACNGKYREHIVRGLLENTSVSGLELQRSLHLSSETLIQQLKRRTTECGAGLMRDEHTATSQCRRNLPQPPCSLCSWQPAVSFFSVPSDHKGPRVLSHIEEQVHVELPARRPAGPARVLDSPRTFPFLLPGTG